MSDEELAHWCEREFNSTTHFLLALETISELQIFLALEFFYLFFSMLYLNWNRKRIYLQLQMFFQNITNNQATFYVVLYILSLLLIADCMEDFSDISLWVWYKINKEAVGFQCEVLTAEIFSGWR